MSPSELYDYLHSTLPPGYDYLALLEDGVISARTDDTRWGHSLVTVEVERDEDTYRVTEDGWVVIGWLGAVEPPGLSAETRANIAEIAERERISLDGLAFRVTDLHSEELSDAVVRMLRALHAVVELEPMYAAKPEVAAD